jgi:hypothetical protein
MPRLFLALIVALALAVPAGAATGLTFLPATAGQRFTVHVTHATQTLSGPQSATSTFSIVRREGATFVLQRTGPSGAPDLSVLKAGADGSLALTDPRTAADGDLADLLVALNLGIAATREGDPAGSGTWLAVLPVTPAPRATTAPLVLVPGTVSGSSFDFSGQAQTTSSAPAPPRGGVTAGGRGGGGMGGGFPGGGGGFPGGGQRRGGSNGEDERGGPPGESGGGPGTIALTTRIDGHVANGRVNRIAITQTRSVTVGNMPFFNIGSWTIAVDP